MRCRLARLAFRYGPLTVPSTIRPPPRRVSHDGKLYDLARDRAGEQKAIEALTLLGLGRVAQLAPVYYQHAHTDDFALNEAAGEATWLAIVVADRAGIARRRLGRRESTTISRSTS